MLTCLDTVCEVKRTADVVLLSSVAILRPDTSKVLPTFLRYYLDSDSTRRYLKSAFVTGAAIPRVILEDFKRAKITVPPLPAQRRIASILSAYDDLIENNTRRIAILEEVAQRLYREWFVEYRFPGHEGVRMVDPVETLHATSLPGPIPEGWEVKRFSDIADVLSGGTPKTTVPEYWGGAIPFYTPKDAPSSFYATHTEQSITEIGLAKCNSKLYPKDTVFITARGTVGKVALASTDMAMNQSCYALVGRQNLTQYFVFLAINNLVDQLKKTATGGVFDTIVVDTFRRLPLVVPSQDSIEALNRLAEPIFAQVLTLTRKNANLRRTRDLLLPRLVSGDVDVEGVEERSVQT